MKGGLTIPEFEALSLWMRPERERGSQDDWREQKDFMVFLLVLAMYSTQPSHAKRGCLFNTAMSPASLSLTAE